MSYWRLFYHITWATKNRMPLIDTCFEQDLYRVMIAKAKSLGAMVYAVGGVENHVHLAASIPPTIAIDSFIGQIKGNSSHFINSVIQPDFVFIWQREFGIVSFGGKHLPIVVEYVHNQKQHHTENDLFTALETAGAGGRKDAGEKKE